MEARLRFAGAVTRDPDVEAWFATRNDALGVLARAWFERMRDCGQDVVELVHDGCPVACVQDVPFAYANAFTKHVNVGFFMGAFLPDPSALLKGTGKRMRHVKLFPGEQTDASGLAALIDAAYRDARNFVAEEPPFG
ncbi:MAG: DUF1801 domain-containing protein [Gammaproteobacteria bacterium]|nr:DUF1801 domain-containing protein [Gammaproteobacteria bacterium]MYF31489.1 DUF1801 domain-containing protein [Gammaproteobacteria bacterium]MYK46845.1 DUF1801 domain-containing protein [Gammaproteobacteria bacterium]